MADYARLIDAETWAFIEATAAFYPPDAVTLSVAEQRAVYDEMCRAFHAGRPEGVLVSDLEAGGVPCRLYEPERGPAQATVVYLHGGGFVVGGLDSHDDVCAEICAETGFRVLSVDYRLSPEHVHPAAFEDARAATRWAAARWPGPLLLAGDSAGGNLAAAVAHAARRGGPPIAGQVLIYPGLGGDMSRGSYLAHAEAPMLTRADLEFYAAVRTGGAPVPEGDATFAPLHDSDFSGLPPTFISTAECDPLSSDGEAYAEAIRGAGGQAAWVEEKGLVHGHLRARKTVRRAADAFARIVSELKRMGDAAAGR